MNHQNTPIPLINSTIRRGGRRSFLGAFELTALLVAAMLFFLPDPLGSQPFAFAGAGRTRSHCLSFLLFSTPLYSSPGVHT